MKDGETEFRYWFSDDSMFGKAGNDTLVGKYGHNQMSGGGGNDTLVGGLDSEDMLGGDGDDLLEGGGDGDLYLFAAGWGHDTISDREVWSETLGNSVAFTYWSDPITADLTVTLTPGPGPEATDGINTIDWGEGDKISEVHGGGGNDTFTGNAETNWLDGGSGTDTITAGDGDDTVVASGDSTTDHVDCGPGTDKVSVDPGNVDQIANCETVTVSG